MNKVKLKYKDKSLKIDTKETIKRLKREGKL